MPDFRDTTTDLVYEFLQRAATDVRFRETLESGSKSAVRKELQGYKVKVTTKEIPRATRTVPAKEVCESLIAQFELDNQLKRARFDCASSELAPLILVVAYAMPLMPTVDADTEMAPAG
jgi:hypothetical protein